MAPRLLSIKDHQKSPDIFNELERCHTLAASQQIIGKETKILLGNKRNADSTQYSATMTGAEQQSTITLSREEKNNECFVKSGICTELLWEALDNSPGELYIFDFLALNFKFINQAALTNLNYMYDEMSKMCLFDLMENYNRNSLLDSLKLLVSEQKNSVRFETEFTRKDGSSYPVDIHIQCSPNKKEKLFYAIVQDVSNHTRSDEKIKILARFPTENPSPLICLAPDASILYHNPASEYLIKHWSKLFPLGHPRHWQQHIDDCMKLDGHHEFEETIGRIFYNWQITTSADKSCVYCYGRDISKQKNAEHDLIQAGKVFDHSIEGIMISDAHNQIIKVNPAFTEITGYTELDALGKEPKFLRSERKDNESHEAIWQSLKSKGIWQGEIFNQRKNGDVYPIFLTINIIKDSENEIENFVSIFADITELKEAQDNIHRLAYYDTLTGLPNRFHIQEKLTLSLMKPEEKNKSLAIIQINIKRFKNINETIGHGPADHLIKLVSQRLIDVLPLNIFLGRLSGDEFLIIIKDRRVSNENSSLIRAIQRGLEKPFNIRDQDIYISVYMGVTHYPADANTAEGLLKHSEAATAYAKKKEANLKVFSKDLAARGLNPLSLESSLRKALEREEFVLHYQPQLELSTNKVIGAEALIRWQHPDKGLIPPLDFIPLLEETGLIIPVGDWVLQAACKQIAEWNKLGLTSYRVAVNLSIKQFNQRNLVKNIIQIISQAGIRPNLVELEVTESTIMRDFDHIVKILTELHESDIKLSIDDFGTGYSSLNHLKYFPIDILKIDQSFVKEIPNNIHDTAIVNTIIAMGHNMNLKVVAEGVETLEQKNCLTKLGCEIAQGYYFSRPLPASDLLVYMNKNAEETRNTSSGNS